MNHPLNRAADQPWHRKLWIYLKRARRDIWMILITGLVLFALVQQQHSRWNATVDACEETNRRHDNTITQLNTQVEKLKPTLTKKELANLERNVKANIALIDALVPKTPSCAALADERVGRPLL
jgi:uncharacterized protein HemX